MSDPLQASPPDNELLQFVELYCNGTISDKEFFQLEQRLRQDPSSRAFYRRYLNLHSALSDYGDSLTQVWKIDDESAPSENWLRSLIKAAVIVAATGVLILLAVLIVQRNQKEREGHPQVIASLEQVNGEVRVISTDSGAQFVRSGVEIKSGDTIRTETALSSARFVFPDATWLSLVGSTSVTCRDDGQKSIVLHGGTMFASVAHQPVGKPMLVATPKDTLEILGTQFSVTATAESTELRVREGRVRLTRLIDGKSVEVAAGQRVVSDAQSRLIMHKIPNAPVEWSEDFERGLPHGWIGKLTLDDLPTGSKGGVQAVRRVGKDQVYFQICTPANWAEGLFTAHEDSHLHIRLRMEKPGQTNVFLLTRTKEEPPAFSSNYLFDQPQWWPPKAGQWCTVTIPLAKFRRLSPGRVPLSEVIPFQLLSSSPDEDTGLVIDQVWVTRGGPNVVETKLVK